MGFNEKEFQYLFDEVNIVEAANKFDLDNKM